MSMASNGDYAMQASTVRQAHANLSTAPSVAGPSDFLIGLILTALVPAIFWVSAYAVIAGFAGYPAAPSALIAAGLAIAGFLGTFFAIFTARHS
ncbi:MAG: hypothetical protein CTY28_04715 [Hyphomicrobium sp.]|jgi:hypothetical protein|nr:MAG: hypothetical protein CTY28_04715 [Hyphomicrobium sp.]